MVVLNMQNDTTHKAHKMKIPRIYFGITTVPIYSTIIVCGGTIVIDDNPTCKCEQYTNGQWTFMPSLPMDIGDFSMTTLNDTPYTFCGWNGTVVLNKVWEYGRTGSGPIMHRDY